MTEESAPVTLSHEDAALLMPTDAPSQRLVALTLAVHWTAREDTATLVSLLDLSDQFIDYMANGRQEK